MNFHIEGLEGDHGYQQILWRVDGIDGMCMVRDGRVETPQLCENLTFEMRAHVVRDIRQQCQTWLDEKPDRDREYQEWDARHDEVQAAWEKHEEVFQSRWAIPSVDAFPYDIVFDPPLETAVVFMCEDDDGDRTYFEPVICPTWHEVFRLFDKSIGITGDCHHVYLEGVYRVPDGLRPAGLDATGEYHNGFPVYEFSTGS